MNTPTLLTSSTGGPDADDLRSIGYRQELHRRLGAFSSFAAGFSFVSILTTVFQLFALGYSFGGPAFFWTWPLVFAGQLCVALVFAELAASWPLAGCIYQWSRRLAGETVGWFAGWAMMIGYVVSVAAIGIALQAVLPAVWSGFQLVGSDPSITSASGAANGILLGSVLIALATVISAVGVRFMALINGIGVTCELVGVVLLLVLLFGHAQRGPGIVTKTLNVSGNSPYLYAFLASTLMAAYVMYGFDSAAELSEETAAPRRVVPSAILRALLVSFVGGGFMIVAVHWRHRLRHHQPAEFHARSGAARGGRDLDRVRVSGDPEFGVAGDVQHGARWPAPRRAVAGPGQPGDRNADFHRYRGGSTCDRCTADQPR
jgi:urea carboxylase system permease